MAGAADEPNSARAAGNAAASAGGGGGGCVGGGGRGPAAQTARGRAPRHPPPTRATRSPHLFAARHGTCRANAWRRPGRPRRRVGAARAKGRSERAQLLARLLLGRGERLDAPEHAPMQPAQPARQVGPPLLRRAWTSFAELRRASPSFASMGARFAEGWVKSAPRCARRREGSARGCQCSGCGGVVAVGG